MSFVVVAAVVMIAATWSGSVSSSPILSSWKDEVIFGESQFEFFAQFGSGWRGRWRWRSADVERLLGLLTAAETGPGAEEEEEEDGLAVVVVPGGRIVMVKPREREAMEDNPLEVSIL